MLNILSTPVVFADVESAEHGGGSNCYNCHVDDYPMTSDEEDLHGMTSDMAWMQCGASGCHEVLNASLQTSVHAEVGCEGCHAPVHVSFNTMGTGAWMFVNRLNNSGVIAYKPTLPLSYNQSIYYYDSTNDTTLLGTSIGAMGGEVHWAWTNVSGSAAGISQATRYLVCMNCHFLTVNPAEAGLTRMIQGRTMIAVPDFTLKLSPHTLSDSALRQAASESGKLVRFPYPSDYSTILFGAITSIGLIGLVLWRKRP
jgi:hypothetical protein